MLRTSAIVFALAALAAPGLSQAQRSQALCQGATDNTVDGVGCVSMNFRMWATQDTEGLEEDAIIGVGSADVTLSHADLSALATTRVELAPAPGAGKYLFVDWVVMVKTAADGAPTGSGGGRVGIGVGVAPATGGLLTTRPTIYAQAVSGFGSGGVLADGATIGRFSPTAVGVAEATAENTPIVAAVLGSTADWDDVIAELDTTVELRIITRYRVIDTADVF